MTHRWLPICVWLRLAPLALFGVLACQGVFGQDSAAPSAVAPSTSPPAAGTTAPPAEAGPTTDADPQPTGTEAAAPDGAAPAADAPPPVPQEKVMTAKPGDWKLAISGTAKASLRITDDGVAVDVGAPGTSMFQMQLHCRDFPIVAGRWYTLTFEAKAKRPRRFLYNLSMAHAPWQNLGFSEQGDVSMDWKEFRAEFVATASDEQAGVYFPIGASPSGLEVRNLKLSERVQADVRAKKWTLTVARHTKARLEFPEADPAVVRVEIEKAGRNQYGVAASTLTAPVKIYKRYAVRFRARADEERSASCIATQSYNPHPTIGLFKEFELTPDWEDFRIVFTSSGNDEQARIAFLVGDDPIAVEIADVRIEPLDQRVAAGPEGPPSRGRAALIVLGFWVLVGAILFFYRQRVRNWLVRIKEDQLEMARQRAARDEARQRKSLSRRRA